VADLYRFTLDFVEEERDVSRIIPATWRPTQAVADRASEKGRPFQPISPCSPRSRCEKLIRG
jgi:hypothetical protein